LSSLFFKASGGIHTFPTRQSLKKALSSLSNAPFPQETLSVAIFKNALDGHVFLAILKLNKGN
jgi:hypothetical protein